MSQKELLSRKEAANYIRQKGYPVVAQTLANMAANGNARKGPPYTLIRRIVGYRREDLDAWIAANAKRVE